MATKKKTTRKKPETTSASVASIAGAALAVGPMKSEVASILFATNLSTHQAFLLGAKWWHKKIRSVLASALTQAPARKRVARKAKKQ